jgi:two-component system, NarL family, response regulator DesR
MSTSTPRRCRVFLAENNADLATTLSAVIGLEPDLECVGSTGNGTAALAGAIEAQADVMILDFSLPGRNAFGVLDDARASGARVGILVYTGHAAPELAAEARSRGAMGYVVKGVPFEALAAEIRRIYAARAGSDR